MPKLVIDDQQIDVAPGTKVIEAAGQLGIMIPRFCYHPALGSVGACRVCAVKFLQGPLKGLQMSCMVEAQDGMVVSTTDAEAVDFRRYVIEWLMLNHPHDCPVCDEGGHCLLQDMTVSGGHGMRRYAGNKRTYPDQYLGPLIQHEMNRCIHCYRCSRYYQEFAGYHDLGVMQSANRTYFGRFEDGILQSPFTGNLSDICPTGVYTDKPSRYFGRRWDYQRSPSLCISCCLGCHTIASIRYREVRRQEARFSETVNGYFICDRGRYSFFYASNQSRPRQPRIDGQEALFETAVQAASEKLAQIIQNAGPSSIAAAGSARSSLQTQGMLTHICRTNGWRNPVFFMDPTLTSKVKTAVARLEPELAVSLREVEGADCIVVVGADPINEAPMLALAMRQAQRNGAAIVVLDPRPISLPLDFRHLPVPPDDLSGCIGRMIKDIADRDAAKMLGEPAGKFYDALPDQDMPATRYAEQMTAAVNELQNSQRPVIVCGTDIVPETIPGLVADCALFLQATGKNAGLFYLLPGANAFGAGLFSATAQSLGQIIEGVENGKINALILTECDPLRHFAERNRLEHALNKLDLLIVADYLDSEAARKAHIFLPASTLYEAGGIFVNQEGRLQAANQAFEGGIPIAQSGGGDHPPRIYGTGIPGSEARPAWITLARLAADEALLDENKIRQELHTWLSAAFAEFGDLNSLDAIPDKGIRLTSGVNNDLRFAADGSWQTANRKNSQDTLELILVDWTFGTEELSAYAACLQELEQEPCLTMQLRDAADLGLGDGDQIAIEMDNGKLELKLCVAENMASGIMVMPRHRKLPWQIFGTGKIRISKSRIQKAKSA